MPTLVLTDKCRLYLISATFSLIAIRDCNNTPCCTLIDQCRTNSVHGPGHQDSNLRQRSHRSVPKQTIAKQQQETTEVLTAKSRRGARPRGSGGPDTDTNSRTGPPLKSGAAASGNSSRESLLDLNSLRPLSSSSADYYLPLLFHEPQIDENACPNQYYSVANRPCWRTCRKHEPISKKCRPHNTRQ